ncbi:hypothetical protein B0H13DRAFT_1872659 [Mycena leptocephala]|nr:hypothetical protein B0H13DRAFT_1872659 [Mycena leptocephala]
MERRHEVAAGWDEIKKGKDSPGMVQDKDGVSPSKRAGNDPRSGWRRGIRRASGSRCRMRGPKGACQKRVQYPGWCADGVSAAYECRRSGLRARAAGRGWRFRVRKAEGQIWAVTLASGRTCPRAARTSSDVDDETTSAANGNSVREKARGESREDAGCLHWKNLRAGEP